MVKVFPFKYDAFSAKTHTTKSLFGSITKKISISQHQPMTENKNGGCLQSKFITSPVWQFSDQKK
jgi:hypothetical protein